MQLLRAALFFVGEAFLPISVQKTLTPKCLKQISEFLQRRKRMSLGSNNYNKCSLNVFPRRREVRATLGDLTIYASPNLGNLTSVRESGTLGVAILEVGKGLGV